MRTSISTAHYTPPAIKFGFSDGECSMEYVRVFATRYTQHPKHGEVGTENAPSTQTQKIQITHLLTKTLKGR